MINRLMNKRMRRSDTPPTDSSDTESEEYDDDDEEDEDEEDEDETIQTLSSEEEEDETIRSSSSEEEEEEEVFEVPEEEEEDEEEEELKRAEKMCTCTRFGKEPRNDPGNAHILEACAAYYRANVSPPPPPSQSAAGGGGGGEGGDVCAVCLKAKKVKPVLFPCGHSFCDGCWRNESVAIRCPECRTPTGIHESVVRSTNAHNQATCATKCFNTRYGKEYRPCTLCMGLSDLLLPSVSPEVMGCLFKRYEREYTSVGGDVFRIAEWCRQMRYYVSVGEGSLRFLYNQIAGTPGAYKRFGPGDLRGAREKVVPVSSGYHPFVQTLYLFNLVSDVVVPILLSLKFWGVNCSRVLREYSRAMVQLVSYVTALERVDLPKHVEVNMLKIVGVHSSVLLVLDSPDKYVCKFAAHLRAALDDLWCEMRKNKDLDL